VSLGLDREARLFAAACELPARERDALLERECVGDEGLRSRILSLLAAEQLARGLDRTALDLVRAGLDRPRPRG